MNRIETITIEKSIDNIYFKLLLQFRLKKSKVYICQFFIIFFDLNFKNN